ncbi:hypothetical protein PHMEG_0007538 [Phytophthora megakarya]|uniref:Guanylate cyclase domain-containing protein n=1 Tax=Phytophthora megakarya TaxID=4795 RepID=A0A225WKY6_9STRA|nr:hypothetical protein PHMEG_0007538 [Phytophthora megakarya]
MIWALLSIAALTLSAVSAALLVFKFYRDWDVRASSVQWLFGIFFTYQTIGAVSRLIYLVWLTVIIEETSVPTRDLNNGQAIVGPELYRLGVGAVLKLGPRQKNWVTATIIVGDTTQFGLAIWCLLLMYELSKLVARSMDRGDQHERAKIRLYAYIGHICIVIFLVGEIVLALIFKCYSKYAYIILLGVFMLNIAVLIYMITMVVLLKVKGRKYESVHGRFVASPLYRRLKWIMLVYALFAFHFHSMSIAMYAAPRRTKQLSSYSGLSFVLFYLRGFLLSIAAGCSQPCIMRCLRPCIPDNVMVDYTQRREQVTIPCDWEAPFIKPVFVFTDIESSSALWGIDDGRIMQQATQIHDDILRNLLAPYRGYEITTAGDSFQLAFHTIQEAAEYCLAVQLQLHNAKWPKRLHGLVPATCKVRCGSRTIFRGLRVRMGIHDTCNSEGSLIRDVHAVTRKVIYTGASEVIANEIGDLGAGGQIVVTKRIAEWLAENSSQLTIDFVVEPVCNGYSIPRLNVVLDVFQVLPKRMATRSESFNPPQHVIQIEQDASPIQSDIQMHYTLIQTPRQITHL